MQRVIVTVRREDEARERDLEVPADLDAAQLANLVAEALRWQSGAPGDKASYTIKAYPLGRIIQPKETLAAAGVWDGSWLIFHPVTGAAPAVAPNTPNLGRGTPQFVPLTPPPPTPPPPTPYTYAPPDQAVQAQPVTPPTYINPAEPPGYGPREAAPVVPQPLSPTVTGWRSLGLDLPPAASDAQPPQLLQPAQPPPPPQEAQPPQPQLADKPKSSSFVWKQLDE